MEATLEQHNRAKHRTSDPPFPSYATVPSASGNKAATGSLLKDKVHCKSAVGGGQVGSPMVVMFGSAARQN